MALILFCLATIGMTLIIVRGVIFEGVRTYIAKESHRIRRRWEKKNLPPRFSLFVSLEKLLGCVQCAGFWCGLFCGFFLITHESVWISWSDLSLRLMLNRLLMLFCCATAGSFLALMGDNFHEWLFFAKELTIRQVVPLEPPPEDEGPPPEEPEA